jgi:hypothetical protein
VVLDSVLRAAEGQPWLRGDRRVLAEERSSWAAMAAAADVWKGEEGEAIERRERREDIRVKP